MRTILTVAGILAVLTEPAFNGHAAGSSPILPGFDQQILDRNDDGSTGLVPIGFSINFFGQTEDGLYVNNNGNVTFGGPLSTYTPSDLSSVGTGIIAPFWADVDTRNTASGIVTYGTGTVNGFAAFGVNWVNVGYYNQHADALLSCQLVIIDRSDLGAGDFDMEFNYGQVQWQWGDVSVGSPPRAGFSDGTTDFELPGSGVDGAFMDTNTVTGLIYNDMNSDVAGQYDFSFEDGIPAPSVPEPATGAFVGLGLMVLAAAATKKRGRRTAR